MPLLDIGTNIQNHLIVSEPYFSFINEGKKNIEGRRGNNEKFIYWINHPVLIINANNGNETIKGMILEAKWYRDVRSCLEDVDLKKILPNVSSVEEGLKVYEEIYPGDIIKNTGGFWALDIKL